MAVALGQFDTDAATKVHAAQVLFAQLGWIIFVVFAHTTNRAVVVATSRNTHAVAAALLQSLAGFPSTALRTSCGAFGKAVPAVLRSLHTFQIICGAALFGQGSTTGFVFAYFGHFGAFATRTSQLFVGIADTKRLCGGIIAFVTFIQQFEGGAFFGAFAAIQGWFLASFAQGLGGFSSIVTSLAAVGFFRTDGECRTGLNTYRAAATNCCIGFAIFETVVLCPQRVTNAQQSSIAFTDGLPALFAQFLLGTGGLILAYFCCCVANFAARTICVACAARCGFGHTFAALAHFCGFAVSVFVADDRGVVDAVGVVIVIVIVVDGVVDGVIDGVVDGVVNGIIDVGIIVTVGIVIVGVGGTFYAGEASGFGVGFAHIICAFGFAIIVAFALAASATTSEVEAADQSQSEGRSQIKRKITKHSTLLCKNPSRDEQHKLG